MTWQQEMLTNWRKRIFGNAFSLSLSGRKNGVCTVVGGGGGRAKKERIEKRRNPGSGMPRRQLGREERFLSFRISRKREKTLFADVGSLSYKDASVS